MSQLNISDPVMEMIFSAIEEALSTLQSDQHLVPFVLLLTKGGVVLRRFADEDIEVAIERAQTAIGSVDEETLAYAFVYDGQIEMNGKDLDALMLEAGENGKETGWRFIQRYQAKTSTTPMYPIGDVAYLGNCKNYMES